MATQAERTESDASPGRRSRRPAIARVATFRNSRGELRQPASVTASEAKGEFGRVLEIAALGGAVVITRHDAPKAVLISIEDFNALSDAAHVKLGTLDREFDALLDTMQTPHARQAMEKAFRTSGKAMGKAAVTAAGKRGR